MLTSEMKQYIDNLKKAFPSIEAVWLIGSRANETCRDDSDWDFLVFSSIDIFKGVKGNTCLHRIDVDLLLVDDKGNFAKPFGEEKGGSLQKWKWCRVTEDLANYEGCKWIPDEEAEGSGISDLGNSDCQTLQAHRVV